MYFWLPLSAFCAREAKKKERKNAKKERKAMEAYFVLVSLISLSLYLSLSQ